MQSLDNANYASISAFMNSLSECRNPVNEKNREGTVNGDLSSQRTDGLGAGCETGRDVQDLMRDGWMEGRERANKMRETLSHIDLIPQDRRRKRVRREQGDTLDIHSVYSGRLDVAWTRTERRFVSAPQYVSIAINVGAHGSMHPDVFFWRGGAAMVLAEILEAAGYRVRLVMARPGVTCGGDENISCRITLKDYDAPLDITSVASTLLPGFTRALIYGWTYGHAAKQVGVGLAMSYEKPIKLEPGEIELPQKIVDQATATKWLQDTLHNIENTNQEAA